MKEMKEPWQIAKHAYLQEDFPPFIRKKPPFCCMFIGYYRTILNFAKPKHAICI